MENSVTKPPKLPMGREGSLIELVAAARYFLSDEARYVTGANLEVAGGWNL
jgi:3-oxoacyl-[acyl-carrier protein] reductase